MSRIRVPSTPYTLLSIYIWIVSCEKDEKKIPGSAHFENILIINHLLISPTSSK